MKTSVLTIPAIKGIEFVNNSIMFIYLDNDRTIIVPLNKLPKIQSLTDEERKDYEIIDNSYLSFITIDEIYSVGELAGII